MIYHYNRSPVLSWSELSDEQQEFTDEDSREDSFVVCDDVALPLSGFERLQNSRYHGVMGVCNTAAYVVILSKRNDSAIVALIG